MAYVGTKMIAGDNITFTANQQGDLIINSTGGSQGGSEGFTYSYEEQWTGNYWLDGRKIYRKTVDCGFLPNTAATKKIPHHIDNFKQMTSIYGICSVGILLPHSSPNLPSNISVAATDTEIHILTGTDRSTTSAIATVEYTCTDR